ncbi:MAG: cytochrome c oxidase subunit II [Phycisphaerales bacterium]|nr:cytochrome c oxidase subunit II [Phycisphaerales bacterium]
MLNTLAQIGERLWMPDQASTYAHKVDNLFYFIYWVSVGAFVLILAAMIFFIIRFRHRAGHKAQPSPSHSTALEITWSIIPALVFLAIFYYAFVGFLDMAQPPDYAYDIQVTAYQWGWEFQYPNGATSPDLYVPQDKPIRLVLQSSDVIHSLFVPAFRIKKDAVPGRYNSTWFQAKDLPPVRPDGQRYYDLYCAEYCGTKHALMRARVFVMDSTEFANWLENAANWVAKTPPAEAGQRLYTSKGCTQCHSLDGSRVIGPSFKNIYGYEHVMRDGTKVMVDENYIRESILVPGAKVLAGYDNVMPTYQGRMKDLEITAIVEWMKTLSDKGPPPMTSFPTEEAK